MNDPHAIIAVIEGLSATVMDPISERIKEVTAADPTMIDLKEAIIGSVVKCTCEI